MFDESGKSYQIKIICEEDKEMLIRSVIINHISEAKLVLTDLESNNIAENKVQIIAKMNGHSKHKDEIAETLVHKISSEQHVTSVGWEIL